MKRLGVLFGLNLKTIRKSKQPKVTAADLAKKMNKSLTTVFNWENGKAWPGADEVEKLAELLEVPAYIFFMDNTEKQSVTPDLLELKGSINELLSKIEYLKSQTLDGDGRKKSTNK